MCLIRQSGIVLALAILSASAYAQPVQFERYSTGEGLTNHAVTAVLQDSRGFLWVGTFDGLNRYDGSSIKVYKPDPFLKGTISNNVIRDLLEDGEGNLWIVTHLGINRYSRNTNSFQIYLDSLTDIPFLEYNIRACIDADSSVLISLIGKGISKYSRTEDRFMPVFYQGVANDWLTSIGRICPS